MTASIPSSTLEKFITFGDLLRFLRRRVGLTQMQLAVAVGYSNTQISRLEQNDRLPDIPTIEARFISVLELEEDPKAVERLLDLAANVRREDAPMPGLCPYQGLNYFDESDANLFVGREGLVAKLTERIFSLISNELACEARFLAIVGASGSGKSSLIRAGLVYALRWNKASTDWQIHVLTPTAHPLESLAMTLTQESDSMVAAATLMDDLRREERSLQLFAKRLLEAKNSSRLLLVIDQFEELFALCRSEEERAAFIGNLLRATSEPQSRVIVVITLRADFYAPCANYPALREALAEHQEYIGAMNDTELRRAIEVPAQRGHWEFEPGLVDLLLHDVGHEPGALPLLSHALFETWQRRRGRTMTLSGYTSSGGVRGAIAETAESVFADQFTHEQQAIARRIFLRLTELGNESGAGDTRRRATFGELILKHEDTHGTQAVLKILADSRLITLGENTAEVVHEALIREWPTLHNWLEENREGLRLHRQLTEAANEWLATHREPDLLFRGGRLAQVHDWAITHADEMNSTEKEFVAASQEWAEHEAAERESQRQRELETAQKLADTERARAEEQAHSANRLRMRNRVITTVGSIAIILALLVGMFGLRAQSNLTHAEAQRLALEASNLMLSNGDPSLIALLTIRSLKLQYTSSGDAVLTNLTGLEAPPILFAGHTDAIHSLAISPDGKYLVTGSQDTTVRLWDIAIGQTVHIFTDHTAPVEGVAFSPDGKYLVASSDDRSAIMWDVTTSRIVQTFSSPVGIGYIAFSPDGRHIVGTGNDPTVRIWDVFTGRIVKTLSGHNGEYTTRVAYSPDGKYVLTGGADNTARLWDAATGKQMHVFVDKTCCSSVGFTPDGKMIALGDEDTIKLYDAVSWEMVREFVGHKPGFWVSGIAFSPDGNYMISTSADGTSRLWEVATGQFLHYIGSRGGIEEDIALSRDGKLLAISENGPPAPAVARGWNLQRTFGGLQFVGHSGPVGQASFSPDGKRVITSSADHTARIWDVRTGQTLMILDGHTDEVRGAVFSPDGNLALTASADGTARLWDVSTGKELQRFEGHTDVVYRAAFSPDSKYIVTASWDHTARVWDTQTGKTMLSYRNQNSGHVNRIAFSPDGKMVATSGDDGTARIWDPLTGKDLMVFKHDDGVTGLAFSPDGKELVTGSFDGTVRLWDVTSGKEIRRFAGHPGIVYAVAFSPDGKYILSGGEDATARLWDVQTGLEVRRFAGHMSEIRNVTFSPDGKFILTASNDGTARLWPTDLQYTIHGICTTLTRDLTPEERVQFGISDQGPTCPTQ